MAESEERGVSVEYAIALERFRQANRRALCRRAARQRLRGMVILEQYCGSFGGENKSGMKESVSAWSYHKRVEQFRCWLRDRERRKAAKTGEARNSF